MELRIKEAARYLGFGKQEIDEKTKNMIEECFVQLTDIAEAKCTYQKFALSQSEDGKLQFAGVNICSKDLGKNLKGCKEILLFAATLGISVDRHMKKLEVLDMARAVVFQACAAAYLEEYCDKKQQELEKHALKTGEYLRPRFSPGYGDFSILHQQDILQILGAAKQIGLTMTDGYMLNPTKSITAVIGVSRTKDSCDHKGCMDCTKEDCLYRRSEEPCG